MKKTVAKKKAKKSTVQMRPKKSPDMPVTQKNLDETRGELTAAISKLQVETKTEFALVRSEMKAEFANVRSEMKTEFANVRSEMKAEFANVRSEMKAGHDQLRAEINSFRSEMLASHGRLEAMFQAMAADTHRTKALVEEQNAKFNFALDGYAAVDHRITALEKKIQDV